MPASLTVAFVPGVSPAKWARIWRERLPDDELLLRPIGAAEVAPALDPQGGAPADMCFARLPAPEGLSVIPLWTETAVVALPKDSPLADLDMLTSADLEAVTVLDAGPVPADIAATLDLVETNTGVAVLPQSLFRAASRKDLVGRPLADAPGTQIALVWRAASSDLPLVQEFIGIVRGRSANSSRGRTDDTEAPAAAPAPAKKQPTPKQKPIPGGPNSRGAQLANAKYKSGTRRTGGSGPKGKKRRG